MRPGGAAEAVPEKPLPVAAAPPLATPSGIATNKNLVEGILELLAGAEAGLLGRLDGDLFAGLRIAALAARPRRHNEHAEPGEPDFFARLKRGRDQIEHAIHRLGGVILRQAGMVGQLLD